VQLGKLRGEVGRMRDLGAEVMAISNDDRSQAQQMAAEFGGGVIVLSDPAMDVISRYGMGVEGGTMAEMGYVVIDGAGKVRVRKVDPLFGTHAEEIVNAVRDVVGARLAGGQLSGDAPEQR